jgi:hypothetical protein
MAHSKVGGDVSAMRMTRRSGSCKGCGTMMRPDGQRRGNNIFSRATYVHNC